MFLILQSKTEKEAPHATPHIVPHSSGATTNAINCIGLYKFHIMYTYVYIYVLYIFNQ